MIDVDRVENSIGGLRGEYWGGQTLTANFDAGTLSGPSQLLLVKGTINGTKIGGTATASFPIQDGTVFTVETELGGVIGSKGVIAGFHGSDASTVVVGGLVGVAN